MKSYRKQIAQLYAIYDSLMLLKENEWGNPNERVALERIQAMLGLLARQLKETVDELEENEG